jgi:hypothetical protein
VKGRDSVIGRQGSLLYGGLYPATGSCRDPVELRSGNQTRRFEIAAAEMASIFKCELSPTGLFVVSSRTGQPKM